MSLKIFFFLTEFSSPFTKEKSKKKDKKTDLFLDDNAIPCEKKSKLRLFRTPSLPYRLKFRSHPVSDLTPSKKNSKPPASSCLTPTPSSASTVTNITPIPAPPAVSIFRKSERNLLEKKSRDEKYIEKLKIDIEGLNKQIEILRNQNVTKTNEIYDLNNDIDSMKIAEEFLEKITEQAIKKISQSDEKVKEILHNYDILLHHMDRMSRENENLLELNENLTKSNDEFSRINEERILEVEKKLRAKIEELVKTKQRLSERNNLMKNFEFELGKKTMENHNLSLKLDKSEEHLKIFEVQHEENLKMMKTSYENEIFFLYSQLSKTQNQLVKVTKNQRKVQAIDLETQIDFENQKTKFEIEKKNYDITIKNFQNVIEVLSLRLKESDTDVENVMAENLKLKSEISVLKVNYEKLRNSAEELKKNFDGKNHLIEQLMVSSETEMIAMISKMNEYFNGKFHEIDELRKSFDLRDQNLKKMSSTLLEEYTIGIELARIELDDKQKRILELESEMKEIKLENLQIKMKLNEGKKSTILPIIQEETDEEKKNMRDREEENLQLKLKVVAKWINQIFE